MRQLVTIAALLGAQTLFAAGNAYAGVPTVPEPGTLTLVGVGAAVVAIGSWWRSRKK